MAMITMLTRFWLLAILSMQADSQLPGCEDSEICESYLPAECLENDLIKMRCPSLCGECTIAPRYVLTDWSPWSPCQTGAEVVQRFRFRRCIDESTNSNAPKVEDCPDADEGGVQEEICNLEPVGTANSLQPQWNEWSEFSPCSATCGDGQSFRTRRCSVPNQCVPQGNIRTVQAQPCNLGSCVTLSDWTACSQTCGGGFRSRRSCNGGACKTITEDCNAQQCIRTAQWSQWGPFSVCSVTCGSGQSYRMRGCSVLNACQPEGNIGPFQVQSCNLGSCETLSDWTPCSRTCGGGRRSRQNCDGTSCSTVFQDCNTQRCVRAGRQEIEYVARTFLRSITSVSSGIWSRQKCPEDFETSDKSVRMMGAPCPNRRAKRQVPDQTYKPKSKRDVLFMIDESASVGAKHFKTFLKLAQTIIDKSFCGNTDIGSDKTRVGMLSFDSQYHLHMDLRASFLKANLMRGIGNINFNATTSGFTCVGRTLQYVRQSVLTAGHGARVDDDDTEQILIILSDGCTYCMSPESPASDVKMAADEFKKSGVPVITFLVGAHSDECIEEMKSLMDGTRCYQLFEFEDWDEVDVAISTLEAAECPNQWTLSQC